jgi:hypothetical protein
MSECPNCGGSNVSDQVVTQWIAYGSVEHAFQATFPVATCGGCEFSWRDHRAGEAKEKAVNEGLAADEIEARKKLAGSSPTEMEVAAAIFDYLHEKYGLEHLATAARAVRARGAKHG